MSQTLSQELCEELKTTGMRAKSYARSPVSGAGFIINQSNNQIRTWVNEGAEVEITGKSKKHRQATMTVVEGPRVLERTNQRLGLRLESYHLRETLDQIMARVHAHTRFNNPLMIPNGRRSYKLRTTQEQIALQLEDPQQKDSWDDSLILEFRADYKAETKTGQTFNLLCGIDEVAHFICALPEKAGSVKDAHEMLRPKGLDSSTKRQGEFFFKPLNKKKNKRVAEHVRLMARRRNDAATRSMYLERGSSHFATCAIRIKGVMYVTGPIMDTRPGRHEALNLVGWHEVVRNNEIRMPQSATQSRTQYWD